MKLRNGIASKRTYLRINVTREICGLYTKNHKTLWQEIKEKMNKWRGILYSQIRRLNVNNTAILPK